MARRALKSDAVRCNWTGAIEVELRHAIRSDWPASLFGPVLRADAGLHPGVSNQHGAVSVLVDGGKTLGAFPAEVVRWRYQDSPAWFVWRGSRTDGRWVVP